MELGYQYLFSGTAYLERIIRFSKVGNERSGATTALFHKKYVRFRVV